MADVLNETQVAEFQDAFKAVDTDHDGFIASSQLGIVLRSIGQNPTDAEVQVVWFLALNGTFLAIFLLNSDPHIQVRVIRRMAIFRKW